MKKTNESIFKMNNVMQRIGDVPILRTMEEWNDFFTIMDMKNEGMINEDFFIGYGYFMYTLGMIHAQERLDTLGEIKIDSYGVTPDQFIIERLREKGKLEE